MRGIQIEMTDKTIFGQQKLVIGRTDDRKAIEMHCTVDDTTVRLLITEQDLPTLVKSISAL
jgi:hypothetical protein